MTLETTVSGSVAHVTVNLEFEADQFICVVGDSSYLNLDYTTTLDLQTWVGPDVFSSDLMDLFEGGPVPGTGQPQITRETGDLEENLDSDATSGNLSSDWDPTGQPSYQTSLPNNIEGSTSEFSVENGANHEMEALQAQKQLRCPQCGKGPYSSESARRYVRSQRPQP
jgi:hypothetical protein